MADKLTGPEYTSDRLRELGATPPEVPYNIIFINSDTYRYDNLFDRADMPVRTPNLDAFSKRAVSMTRFYTGSFPTIPERTDLISGRYGWPWIPWKNLDQNNILPQLLNKHGYVTQLLCDCPHLFNHGFQRVFNAANQIRGQEGDIPQLHMNDDIKQMMPREKTRTGHHFQDKNLVDLHRWTNRYYRCEEDTFPHRTASQVVRWLEENDSFRPFFLWVDFFDPHEPWDPPEYMVRKYDPDYTGTPMMHPNYGLADDYTPEELRNLRAHYCAEAELVDRWVGRILQKIDDLDLWKNTIVVFTTDHGISLGEHNRTGKSNINTADPRRWPLYPEVAHIPFLVAAPGLEGNREINLLAQPVDIMPTLAELCGLDLNTPDPLHGISLAPALYGDTNMTTRDFAICGCHLRTKDGKVPDKATTPVLYTEKWAYAPIGPNSETELYDLDADPDAEKNLAGAHPEQAELLHQQLIDWFNDLDAPDEAVAPFISK